MTPKSDIGQPRPKSKRLSWRDYYSYIQSEAWQVKRRQFFEKSTRPKQCAACAATKGLDLHHKTYKRLGCEYLSDLELLCRTCHNLVHDWHKQNKKSHLHYATRKIIRRVQKEQREHIPAPSLAEIMAAQTKPGGWNKETLASWGISWPPRRGWKKRLVRKHYHEQRMKVPRLHVNSARLGTETAAEVRDVS